MSEASRAGVRIDRYRSVRRQPVLRCFRGVRKGISGRHSRFKSRFTIAAPRPATLHVLPTVWFRNTWSWGENAARPDSSQKTREAGSVITASHRDLGQGFLYVKALQSCCLPRMKRTPSASSIPRTARLTSRTESTTTSSTAEGPREPARIGDEGRGALLADRRRRKNPESLRLRLTTLIPQRRRQSRARRACSEALSMQFFRHEDRKPTNSTRAVIPSALSADEAQCHAPGTGGHAVDEAVLLLRR